MSGYIEKFLSHIEVDDKVNVDFTSGGNNISYYGKVKSLSDSHMTLENLEEMELFDALAYPQVIDVPFNHIWFYIITKPDGSEYYA